MVKNDVRRHFDTIAERYKEEIPDHIRDYLAQKWWGGVEPYFHGRPRVIDIGCGDGTIMMFLKRMGIAPVGIELSANMVRRGKERYPELEDSIFEGSALNVEFPDHAFDVAMMTGVLHHIYSRADQMNAVREALRVVKRDGMLIIRESSLINPLFRIFWNYIFPLTAKIDRWGGGELDTGEKIAGGIWACGSGYYFLYVHSKCSAERNIAPRQPGGEGSGAKRS